MKIKSKLYYYNTLILLVLSIFALGFTAACGIKPSELEPPAGTSVDAFPGTYPDPATDPAPRSMGK